jgi:hypothetical protein
MIPDLAGRNRRMLAPGRGGGPTFAAVDARNCGRGAARQRCTRTDFFRRYSSLQADGINPRAGR